MLPCYPQASQNTLFTACYCSKTNKIYWKGIVYTIYTDCPNDCNTAPYNCFASVAPLLQRGSVSWGSAGHFYGPRASQQHSFRAHEMGGIGQWESTATVAAAAAAATGAEWGSGNRRKRGVDWVVATGHGEEGGGGNRCRVSAPWQTNSVSATTNEVVLAP